GVAQKLSILMGETMCDIVAVQVEAGNHARIVDSEAIGTDGSGKIELRHLAVCCPEESMRSDKGWRNEISDRVLRRVYAERVSGIAHEGECLYLAADLDETLAVAVVVDIANQIPGFIDA